MWGSDNVPSLPAGPWLAGLREAALNAGVAAVSLAALAVAPCLERLALMAWPYRPADQREYDTLLRWANSHAPLRLLAISLGPSILSPEHPAMVADGAPAAQLARVPPRASLRRTLHDKTAACEIGLLCFDPECDYQRRSQFAF